MQVGLALRPHLLLPMPFSSSSSSSSSTLLLHLVLP
jgi:hypothetical protein